MKGIKVSKPGISTDSEDPRDFTIHSQYNIFKIAQEGYGQVDGTWDEPEHSVGWEGYKIINHGLGYKPQVFFHFTHPSYHTEVNGDRWFQAPGVARHADANISAAVGHQDDNNIVLRLQLWLLEEEAGIGLTDIKYKYLILIEPREDAWYE